jgi:hypothetical protein
MREGMCLSYEAFVRPAHGAQTAMVHENRFPPAAFKIVKVTQ